MSSRGKFARRGLLPIKYGDCVRAKLYVDKEFHFPLTHADPFVIVIRHPADKTLLVYVAYIFVARTWMLKFARYLLEESPVVSHESREFPRVRPRLAKCRQCFESLSCHKSIM